MEHPVSEFAKEWGKKLTEAFPLVMGENERGWDFKEREVAYPKEAEEFVESLLRAWEFTASDG